MTVFQAYINNIRDTKTVLVKESKVEDVNRGLYTIDGTSFKERFTTSKRKCN